MDLIMDLWKLDNQTFKEFKESFNCKLNDIFNKELNDNFVLEYKNKLYINETLSKKEVVDKVINQFCLDFEPFIDKQIKSSRELLIISIKYNNISYNNKLIRSIEIDFLNSQKLKWTSTCLNHIVIYFIDGDLKINKFNEELNLLDVSNETKKYLEAKYFNDNSIFATLNSVMENSLFQLAETFRNCNPKLTKVPTIDYINRFNPFSDDLKITITNNRLTIRLLYFQESIVF